MSMTVVREGATRTVKRKRMGDDGIYLAESAKNKQDQPSFKPPPDNPAQ